MDMETVSETLEYKLHFYKADEHENLQRNLVDLRSCQAVHISNPSLIVNQSTHGYKPVAYQGGLNPPPPQNSESPPKSSKFSPIVKTVKNC